MSAAPTKVNVFNPIGPNKEGLSFSKPVPVCPFGQTPTQRFDRVQNPDGTWKSVATGEFECYRFMNKK